MPAFVDIPKGKTPAESTDIQQVIDALSGRRNTPLSTVVNDALSYTYTLKNTDPGSRNLIIYAADGTTVLLQVDGSGVKVSPDGTAAITPLTHLGPTTGMAADGAHIHGAGGYSATGATTLEALFAGTWVNTAVNYAVAAGVMFVFCTAGIVVTLPDAATTNRWIIVTAVTGTSTLASVGGAIHGGSVNTTTGAILDAVISQGDSIMYKSDGVAWRAVG